MGLFHFFAKKQHKPREIHREDLEDFDNKVVSGMRVGEFVSLHYYHNALKIVINGIDFIEFSKHYRIIPTAKYQATLISGENDIITEVHFSGHGKSK